MDYLGYDDEEKIDLCENYSANGFGNANGFSDANGSTHAGSENGLSENNYMNVENAAYKTKATSFLDRLAACTNGLANDLDDNSNTNGYGDCSETGEAEE